ncbi:MAG: hypothetical protein DCO81_06750 [Candidatus Aquiluna sp. XM-24bin5]|nr:MAG: hypothetical protein DCO81_06750 [Candidatus Aquiluna sp. XM-24bin5]
MRSRAGSRISVALAPNVPSNTTRGFPSPKGSREGLSTNTETVVSEFMDNNARSPGETPIDTGLRSKAIAALWMIGCMLPHSPQLV